MSFNVNECEIKQVYCGKGRTVDTQTYTRKGTAYECLRKGYGSGMWNEKKKQYKKDHLIHIPYVTDTIMSSMRNQGIRNTYDLIRVTQPMTIQEKNTFLKKVCTQGNAIHWKAFNSILLFLYNQHVDQLPRCKPNLKS